MKTPLTLTVSAWNYCNNNCGYCVSGSNRPEWNFNGSFEQYAPPGCDDLNDWQLSQKWGRNYYRRMCPDRQRFLNKRDIQNFDWLLKWLLKFTPDARIHISGGEPLLRPDIEDQIKKIVDAGFITTIFTNGMFIHKRPGLLSLPLFWVIAHHPPNDLIEWRRNVALVSHRRIYTTRVLYGQNDYDKKEAIRNLYSDLPFFFSHANHKKELQYLPNPDDIDHIASQVLHLIVPDGRVYACNDDRSPPIGHILKMEYSPAMAIARDKIARHCVRSGICPAYLSALLTR